MRACNKMEVPLEHRVFISKNDLEMDVHVVGYSDPEAAGG